VGFIKDYDGGTLMECVIHPKLPYTDLVNMFRVRAVLRLGGSKSLFCVFQGVF
jgi:hypothetical protein